MGVIAAAIDFRLDYNIYNYKNQEQYIKLKTPEYSTKNSDEVIKEWCIRCIWAKTPGSVILKSTKF